MPDFPPQNDTFFPGPQIAPVGISESTFSSRSDLWYVPTLRTFLLYKCFFTGVSRSRCSGLPCRQKRQISGKFPRNFPGNFPAIPGKLPRDSGETSPQFRGNFPAIPGKFPRDSRGISPNFPGIFPRTCSGNFQGYVRRENDRMCLPF